MRPYIYRSIACAVALSACVADPQPELNDPAVTVTTQELAVASVTRDHVAGDVYHYDYALRVGAGPNAKLHVHRVVRERAPWIPRRTTNAVMMLHGDFATFTTNFAPSATGGGISAWLAERGVDVWGADRRWTTAPETAADLSDFAAMGIDQELDDVGAALTFARATRLITDGSMDRLTLIGFSRGGELAYFYTSREATRPLALRHVKGIVPLDVYASLSPADEELRQFFCSSAAQEYDLLAAGEVDVPNTFQIETGRGYLAGPDDPSPYGLTNRELMLLLVGQTYLFFPASPLYHLNAPVLAADEATALRLASEPVVAHWLAESPPHQAMRESADTDALTCGEGPLPADVPLSRIRVPLFLIAAAGGYGDHAVFSTTQVSSPDVTTLVIRQLPAEREAEDFGHADLLFAPEAPALAWRPLLTWLHQHQ